MYAEERQQRIVQLAQRQRRVAVAALAEKFSVTPETIRRDLDLLTERGLVRRVHGGAVAADQLRMVEPAVAERSGTFLAEKSRIARAALPFVPHGPRASLILDGGTTTAALATLLPDAAPGLVVTNSAQAALHLAEIYAGEVQLIGGRVRGVTGATVGGAAIEALQRLQVDVAFIGANGVSIGHGFSTPDAEESAVKRAMIRAAAISIVIADSSKIGLELVSSFAGLKEIAALITDSGISPEDHAQLAESGLEVVIA